MLAIGSWLPLTAAQSAPLPFLSPIVGERLALLAPASHYRKKITSQGPTYRSSERVRYTVRIHFEHVDGGLKIWGDTLGEFSIAGSDRHRHWAEAKIEGDTVVVSSPAVPEPEKVHYAWQANPRAPPLFNGAGLPAGPFRTDDRPGVTEGHNPWSYRRILA